MHQTTRIPGLNGHAGPSHGHASPDPAPPAAAGPLAELVRLLGAALPADAPESLGIPGNQLGAILRELRAVRRLLRRALRQPAVFVVPAACCTASATAPPSRDPAPAASPENLDQRGRTVSPCVLDILTTLEEVGRPLTRTRLLAEMSRKGRGWAERTVGGYLARMVEDGTLVNNGYGTGYRLPEPPTPPKPLPPPFKPNEMQGCILEALDGKALRTDALAKAAGYERRTLYRKPGGLAQLQEQGLVVSNPDWGYYRPDRPPPGMFPALEPQPAT
jgi:hypothetical protein